MPGERPTYSRATVTITYVENGTAVGPNRPKLRYSFLAQAWCSVLTVFLVWAQVGDVNGMLVSRRFLCISQAPLRSPLFTPVLQWQSRGEWRISQGWELESAAARAAAAVRDAEV